MGREYPVIINGEKIELETKFESINPSNKSQVVGVFSDADSDADNLVERAIDAATEAFKTWRTVPAAERAEYLFKAADIIRERKHYYSAWMVLEVGKTWAEADGDTAEAIDFLEFYGREMIRWSGDQPVTPDPFNEKNNFEYVPLGGWCRNSAVEFSACRLWAGMTMSAVVTGQHYSSQAFAGCANYCVQVLWKYSKRLDFRRA